MSELISGIDVPRLIKEDVSIQYRAASSGAFKEGQWSDFILDEDEEEFTIGDLINDGRWDFRRKPRTITINGIEAPKPMSIGWGDPDKSRIDIGFNSEDEAEEFFNKFRGFV